ncbi:MAG TPA: hypothetical protein VKE22_14045 [Haliangiales bacterium]|nr:hypothetical protein [Haliangiales bacterium]
MRALALLVALAPAVAGAYPQFQFQTGAVRCNQCHFAPAGGGLINGYGREEAGDTISLGGDGSFLHGLWTPPSWLALGGDVRLAGVLNNVGADFGTEVEAFPMQADFYARAAVGAFSAYVKVGYRGTPRSDTAPPFSRLVSREHTLTFRPDPVGPYVRVGRFFAPYGLRVVEHLTFIRRYLGFSTLEETYGLSGGYVSDDWELHATAFVPSFSRPVGYREKGGAAYFETRLGLAAIGAQARAGFADIENRLQAGVVGKYLVEGPNILLLGELDVVRQHFTDADASRAQLVGYLGASTFLVRGLMAQLVLERYDEDLAVKGVARTAFGASLQWFFHAHFEAYLYGRWVVDGSGSADGASSKLVMLQVHYYL